MMRTSNQRLLGVAAALILAGGILAGRGQARTWTQAGSGKKIEADLVKVENGIVFLRLASGQIGEVPVASLSQDDQAYLREFNRPRPADGWPNFRGPYWDGVSPDTGLLRTWPEGGPKRLWSYDKAGDGYSGFAISGGILYTMGTREEDVVVIAIDVLTGEELWSTRISTDDGTGYNTNWGGGPRSTPSFMEGQVYALGPRGTLACLDVAEGQIVWRRHMIDDFAAEPGDWGFAESPFVEGDKLVISPGGEVAGMVALNRKNGEVLWKAEDVKPGKADYATIVPADINGIRQYIRLFREEIVSVDSNSGEIVWAVEWRGVNAVVPTPIVEENRVYFGSGNGAGSTLIEVDSGNNVSEIWRNRIMKNQHGGFIKWGEYVYGFSDGAGLICQSWANGAPAWREKDRNLTKGSIAIADGMIIALNEQNGACSLVRAIPDQFELRGRFFLPRSRSLLSGKGKGGDGRERRRPPGLRIWTHPVVLDGKLYLRQQNMIHCYDVRG